MWTNTGRIFAASISAAILALAAPSLASDQEYTAALKAGRGLGNITTGFLEFPAHVIERSRQQGPWLGVPVGLLEGSVRFVQREVVGVYELLTAPFALPAGYEPVMEPEFAWDHFDDAMYLADAKASMEAIGGVAVERRRGALVLRFPDELLFKVGSARLEPQAGPRLSELARVLQQYPETRVSVKGYTDSTGPAAFNRQLSEARAKAVYDYLVARGVASTRLMAEGYAEARPLASNDSVDGRRLNRRVELEVRAGGVAAR
jgi:putative exosortase-associated protein (TIGR04073 family)